VSDRHRQQQQQLTMQLFDSHYHQLTQLVRGCIAEIPASIADQVCYQLHLVSQGSNVMPARKLFLMEDRGPTNRISN